MEILLNQKLLKFLLGRGFRFCVSKTFRSNKKNGNVAVHLKPVLTRPSLRDIPEGYDTYYNIVVEPLQMAAGIDGTTVMVRLDTETFLAYIKSVLTPVVGRKHQYE